MRHQSARVVFAACLLSAFAAAQAPHSSSNFEYLKDPLGLDAFGVGNPTGGTTASPGSSGSPRFHTGLFNTTLSAPGRRALEAAAQEPDYSMRGMFQQAHGAFMAGRNRYEPMMSVGVSLFPNARVNGEPGSFDLIVPTFDADLPIVVSPEGYIMLGAYYESRHYIFTSSTGLADETLYRTGAKLGFGTFLGQDTLLEVEFQPGLFSDADSTLHTEDWDAPSFALLTHRLADGIYGKIGVRYNEIYADANVLPYIGISWDITGSMAMGEYAPEDSWRLDVMFPEYAELSYWPTPDTGFSLGALVQGAEYHVRSSTATGRQRDDLRVQEVLAYLGFVHRFSDNFSFGLRSGVTLAGDYELTNGQGTFMPVDGALDQTFFAHASIGIDW